MHNSALESGYIVAFEVYCAPRGSIRHYIEKDGRYSLYDVRANTVTGISGIDLLNQLRMKTKRGLFINVVCIEGKIPYFVDTVLPRTPFSPLDAGENGVNLEFSTGECCYSRFIGICPFDFRISAVVYPNKVGYLIFNGYGVPVTFDWADSAMIRKVTLGDCGEIVLDNTEIMGISLRGISVLKSIITFDFVCTLRNSWNAYNQAVRCNVNLSNKTYTIKKKTMPMVPINR